MNEKNYKIIKDMFKTLERMNKREIEEISELVDDVIIYKITNENTIGHVFDKMLSLEFIEENDIKKIYYKLLNYSKAFNKELSDDYENFFIEKFSDDEEEW